VNRIIRLLSLVSAATAIATLIVSAGAAQSCIDPVYRAEIAGRFAPGVRLAIEVIGGSGLGIERLTLSTEDGIVLEQLYDGAISSEAWLGELDLIDIEGEPLPCSTYALTVRTDATVLSTSIVIFEHAGPASGSGESSAELSRTSSTEPGLFVYRLIREEDAASPIHLSSGDKLLIVLEGNPTTGYEWQDTTENSHPVLKALKGMSYLADAIAPGIVGGGGRFLFRYEAVTTGNQILRYDYLRPWESEPPEQPVRFAILVSDD